MDGNTVVEDSIEDDAPVVVVAKSEDWKACHAWKLQYFLQIRNVQIQNAARAFNHHT